MAEYVHQTLEEMIPELEEMTRLGLFTAKETKIILKNRESFEYRLRQLTKTKASFLNYVEYEKKLLELLKIRRKKVASDSRKRELEKSIADRIHQLYRLVTVRFQEDVSLWLQHIDFSKALNEKAYVTRLYEKVLKIHSHNEDVWVQSARWESSTDGNGNHELAREILLKAHRVNPESQTIFLEMYHMELQLAKQIIKRKSVLGLPSNMEGPKEDNGAEEDKTAELKLAEIVYSKGLELFRGLADFHMKMLSITSKFKEARKLQAVIVADLQRLYPTNPYVWNGLALRHLNSLKKIGAEQRKVAVAQCLKVYDEAVEKVPTEAMWSYCLKSYLNLLDVKEVVNKEEVLKSALLMFQKAVSLGTLSEELYSELLSLLSSLSLPEDAARVADRSVEQHPASAALWLAKLRFMVEEGEEDQAILKALRTALRKVAPEESWSLWEFTLNVMASRRSEGLEELMERACRSNSSLVCQPAKEWSLHWTFRQGGIKKARLAYSSLKTMRPISMSFYRLYVQAECAQETPNLKLIRGAFEEALVEFGLNEPDLWLNYVQMEREVAKDGARAGAIQQRALNGLDPHLKETFIRKQVMAGLSA